MKLLGLLLLLLASNSFADDFSNDEITPAQELALEQAGLIQERNKISSILASKLEWSEGEKEWMEDRLHSVKNKLVLVKEKQKELATERREKERKQAHFEQWDVFKNFN